MTIDVDIIEFKAFESNTLRGFLTIRIVGLDLIVADLTIHDQAGKRWVGLPGKIQVDRERKVILGPNGRPAYTPVLRFASTAAGNRFRDAVLAALDAHTRGARAA
jgi:hypothetical protein